MQKILKWWRKTAFISELSDTQSFRISWKTGGTSKSKNFRRAVLCLRGKIRPYVYLVYHVKHDPLFSRFFFKYMDCSVLGGHHRIRKHPWWCFDNIRNSAALWLDNRDGGRDHQQQRVWCYHHHVMAKQKSPKDRALNGKNEATHPIG